MEDTQGYGPYLSSLKMYEFRIKQNGDQLVTKDTIRSPDPNHLTSINIEKFLNTETNNRVWIYSVINGGHGHPGYLDIAAEIWRFFSIYVK